MKRCTPETLASSRPAIIDFERVLTVTVLSTNGTPRAFAILKNGITGSTSNLVQLQIRDGRKMTGRMVSGEDWMLASTARLAARYCLSHSGATPSTCSPSATSGQPASAALTKSTGVGEAPKGSRNFPRTASMTLKAVMRVILSYVLSSPAVDFEPLTMRFRFVRPLFESKSRPMAWTTASALSTRPWTVPLFVASPFTQVTADNSLLSGSGFSPLRLREVTL
mmetsp:Transcript_22376/g.57002  ORF Transcript_22376/g.57002 Transcript_22376/m.57002 type:complete len:223 (+) Transcript_22376:149-817(+)